MSGYFDFEFRQLIRAIKRFTERDMDQWANWRLDSMYGAVFVSMSRQPFPGVAVDSYDDVNQWAENREPHVRGTGIDDFPKHFEWVRDHISVVLGPEVTFERAVAYVQGVDDATDFLDGFHYWLVDRLGGGNSLFWSALARHDYLGTEPVHHSTDLPADWKQRNIDQDPQLVDHLFALIDSFLKEQSQSQQL